VYGSSIEPPRSTDRGGRDHTASLLTWRGPSVIVEQTMGRPPQAPERSEIGSDELEAYDAADARRRAIFESLGNDPELEAGVRFLGGLMASPPLAGALGTIGAYVKARGDRPGSFSHADREWATVAVALESYSGELRPHVPYALAAGVPLEAIRALHEGREEDLGDHERLLLAFMREVTTDSVRDETYDAIERRLGPRGAVEYTIFVAYVQMQLRLKAALGLVWPPLSREEIDAMLAGFGDGSTPLPAWSGSAAQEAPNTSSASVGA
jgi:hypothetical protein